MEYRITHLKADIATGNVFEAHWTLTYTDGPHSAYRYGSVGITPEPAPLAYAGLDESTAIERVKDALGEEFIEAMENSLIAEVALLAAPTVIEGLPWAVPPAPAP
jgi:hypothetical protein